MAWSEEIIQKVWEKGVVDPNNKPSVWRKDHAGAWMHRDLYGNHESVFGWDIDHRKPSAKNGSDNESNLFPLHWENNNRKSDDYPKFTTSITSDGVKNINKEQSWTIN